MFLNTLISSLKRISLNQSKLCAGASYCTSRKFSSLSRFSFQGVNKFSTLDVRISEKLSINFLPSNLPQYVRGFKNMDTESSYYDDRFFMRIHQDGIRKKRPKARNPLGPNVPYAKGVVLKTFSKKPKKPNSANRKCVLLRLSNGKEMAAYVPGEGHNLQEHNMVLVRVKRLRDTPGVKLTCVRGAYDLSHVVKKKQ